MTTHPIIVAGLLLVVATPAFAQYCITNTSDPNYNHFKQQEEQWRKDEAERQQKASEEAYEQQQRNAEYVEDQRRSVPQRAGAPAVNSAANATTGPSATPAAVPADAPFKSVKEQLGGDTIASVERDIKARGGSPGSIRAGSQGIATLSTLSGDYSDAGPYVTVVNYDFDGTGPAARLVAVTVVHSFGVFGDAYKKLTDERKAVLAKDFGALQVKSATESSSAVGGYEVTLFENPDTGFFYERYKRAH